ncbi:glycosyltransferase family 4 protein [Candidatus Uhrbacteria bacterium]|nr:glycosyltransferase family 4 protein [Candidatus Uhrbacteria bacterium]
MRVLMIIGQFRPTIGGAERQCELLARALTARGDTVTVLTVRPERGVAAHEVYGGVTVERVAYPIVHVGTRRIGFGFLAPFLLGCRVWRRARIFDVIHVHQALWPAFVASVAAWRRRKPIIVKLGNSGERFDLDVLQRTHWYGAFARRFLLRHVARFVATSRAVRDDLSGAGIPEKRIVEIPNGVVLPQSSMERISRTALRLVFVGTLTSKKNVAALLDGISCLPPAERERITLTIVGDGPERAALERRVAVSGIMDRVTLRGAVADPAPVLAAADLFALPSRTEGLSNAALEAMANGCALLLSNAGGNSDLIPDAMREAGQPFLRGATGVLIDPQSPEAIAAALRWFLAHADSCRSMGARARSLVAERYVIERVVEQYASLYISLTRPRIVHLLTFLDSLGGMERQALQLAEQIHAMGYQSFFVTSVRTDTMRREQLSYFGTRWGFRIYRIPFVRGWRRWNAAAYLIGAVVLLLILRKRYDVIHAHQLQTSGLIASIARRLLPSKRVMVKNACSGLYGDVGELQRRLGGRGASFLRHGIDQFVGVSDETVAEMRGVGYAPIAHIPNGVRTDRFAPPSAAVRDHARRMILGSGHAMSRLVLSVGRLHAQKNLTTLIDAIAMLSDDVVLLLVGDGPERVALERHRVSRGVARRVRFVGAVEDVLPYYHAADVFVIASRSEGMPNSVLEAMGCGLPIIGSNIAPVRALIRPDVEGTLVDPDDVGGFARAIAAITAGVDDARAMGQRTRERAQEYGADRVTARYATLYTTLMAS